jgi:hypothetical protein
VRVLKRRYLDEEDFCSRSAIVRYFVYFASFAFPLIMAIREEYFAKISSILRLFIFTEMIA